MATEQSRDRQEDQQTIEQSGTTQSSGRANERDLGTVGGGTIPGRGTPRDSTNTGNNAVDSGGRPAEGVASSGMNTSGDPNINAIDRQGQSGTGGRNPGQPQTSMGDRDTKKDHRDEGSSDDITDPMTSRAPDKIKQKKDQKS